MYYIKAYGDEYNIYHENVGIILDSSEKIGETDSLETAMLFIMAHSGNAIEDIKEV